MMNQYIKISLIAMLCLFVGQHSVLARSFRQSVKGLPVKVVDEYGKPLLGAKVYSLTDELLGETSESGEVGVEVVAGTEIIVRHPAYYPKKIAIASGIRIAMVANYLKQEEIRDVLYDQKTAKNLLGAVSSVYNNQLK